MRPTAEQVRKWALAAQEYDLATAFIVEGGRLMYVEFIAIGGKGEAVERVTTEHMMYIRSDEELEQFMRKVAENCDMHGQRSGSFFLDRILAGKPPHRFWFGQEPVRREPIVYMDEVIAIDPMKLEEEYTRMTEEVFKNFFGSQKKGVQGHE